jgi:hypothetical protein
MGRPRHHRSCEQSRSAPSSCRRRRARAARSPRCRARRESIRHARGASGRPRPVVHGAPGARRSGRSSCDVRSRDPDAHGPVQRRNGAALRAGRPYRLCKRGGYARGRCVRSRAARGSRRASNAGHERDGEPERHCKLRRVGQRHAGVRAGQSGGAAPARLGNPRRARAAFACACAPIHVPALVAGRHARSPRCSRARERHLGLGSRARAAHAIHVRPGGESAHSVASR